jgi:uncharacterized protein (TIGR03437 family)
MQIKTFKLFMVALAAIAAFFYAAPKKGVHANSGGPPAARTGAPSEQTCALSGCHASNALNSGPGMVAITGMPDNYTPGQDYTITITATFAGRSRFGFQATILNDPGQSAGTLTVTDSTVTSLQNGTIGGNLRRYIAHTRSGNAQSSWSFRWTAPATAVGRITAYTAVNCADGNGGASNDFIYTTSKSSQPMSAPAAVAAVSAASFSATGALAANSIAALFGTNMAAGVTLAQTNPLPTTLGGVTVRVRDAANTERDAQLFFVSPAQINLLIPDGTMTGTATITVVRDGTTVGQGTVTIDTLAPGLFALSGTGQGLAAAELLRLKADGSLVYEPIARFNTTTGTFEALPISLAANEQAALILYGTGFRANAGLNTVSCTLGGESTEVFFASAQGGFAGLDQANVRLLPSLAGRGSIDIVLTVGGKASNAVTVTMQ